MRRQKMDEKRQMKLMTTSKRHTISQKTAKTLVFALSRYCNRNEEVIPARIIERPPSAELRDDQMDQDVDVSAENAERS